MNRRKQSAGFTLIELLVVVAIIALLISILLPSLNGAREQGKRAVCIANLRSIGTGIHSYASEDRAEQPIPIHQQMMLPAGTRWLWRCADWFTWGGRDAAIEFLPGVLLATKTTETPNAYMDGVYGMRTRPLNKYLYADTGDSDRKKLELYHCPSDRGYPTSNLIDDAPRDIFEKPCYDVIGNSYRGSKYGLYGGSGQCFALGPYGHRMSTLLDTGRLILIGEPTFFNMIGLDDGQTNPDPVVVFGWHKRQMTDNLLYVDGSARSTLATGHFTVDAATANEMNANRGYVSRGPSWRFDTYPTPGARVWGAPPGAGQQKRWPFTGYQDNLNGAY
ncbi:MAG: hypothetical protein CHACPFDD_00428 [Phycisphaerae bacterium]|nr:hypothetical protein [Phycisphaerae bacterium]